MAASLALALPACGPNPSQPSNAAPPASVTRPGGTRIVAGETASGVIRGDDALPDEEVRECHFPPNACVAISVQTPASGTLTARLTWDGAGSELGLRILNDFVFPTWHWEGPGVHGSSPLQVSADTHGGDILVIVSFDKSGGVLPDARASQPFVLMTSFK